MANPNGSPKMSNDAGIWDLPFSFTVGAAGAVTAKSLPQEIRDITLGVAGTYTISLRGRWIGLVGYSIHGISTTYNRCQVTADNSAAASPNVVFTTATESAGVLTTGNLANPTVVVGTLSLRNDRVK